MLALAMLYSDAMGGDLRPDVPDVDETRDRLATIGEIAAEVAHELRNALQVISANAYLAKQAPAKSEAALNKIERNARLAHAIVDDLMALARGEPLHAEPIALAEIMALAREELSEGSARFDDAIEPITLRVRAHPGLLARLFRVLYDNAIAACAPAHPTLRTRASRHGARVIVEVADDGPGVPEAIATTLFEPLVTARPGGTGLGLALARRVARAHGGTIELVRGAGAGGATFRIELPGDPCHPLT